MGQNPNAESNATLMLAAVRQITTRITALEEQVLLLGNGLSEEQTKTEQLRVAVEMLRSRIVALQNSLPAR
jgi:polyhydroxyalkanoate synthesis regulator phasin